MYEDYYGFSEKPFSLTPDPRYLYRGESHGSAFDLLQYAIARREGFVVVTGDIGTGKTTLCRALLEQIDRATFTALVLNPFLSEEDLLKRILLDFGVVDRGELAARGLARATTQDLVDAIYEFLLGLIPRKATAVLIIDEAQNLPLPVLEQIRMLSNLETDKEKLLQIILVGQLDLQALLRSPELRQLDQRVSIRYQLEPLDEEAVGAYVAHRLTVAGGSGAVAFAPDAIRLVHRLSQGIPRLINLICDRALLAAFSVRANRVTPDMVAHAAQTLDLRPASRSGRALTWRVSLMASAAVALLASVVGVGTTAFVYQRYIAKPREAKSRLASRASAASIDAVDRSLPPQTILTLLVGSFPLSGAEQVRVAAAGEVRSTTERLEKLGFQVYYADVDLGDRGRWRRVLAGAYTNDADAYADAARLSSTTAGANARIVTSGFATGLTTANDGGSVASRAGSDP